MTPWTVAHWAPLFIECSRQEYWSGLPFPTLGDLPDPGIELASLAFPALVGGFFTAVPPGKPMGRVQQRVITISHDHTGFTTGTQGWFNSRSQSA